MKYAYVTFIIRNDAFLPGALMLAYGLRSQKTPHDLVAIVSQEVSESARDALKQLYDHVVVLPEFYVAHSDRQSRQDRPFLFSRFNALRLGKDGDLGFSYDKILICDADVLPLRHYDDLFTLNAPAGIINEKKEYTMDASNDAYVIPKSVYAHGTWKWHDIYKDFPMNAAIPAHITDRVKNDAENMGVNAALYLFEPSMDLYQSIVNDTQDKKKQSMIAHFPWPEMQYITQKMSGQWHNMDLRFASFNGYPMIDVLYGIHYAGLKPWKMRHRSIRNFARFEDYRLWYAVYQTMVKRHPKLLENRKVNKLNNQIHELLKDKKYRFERKHIKAVCNLF